MIDRARSALETARAFCGLATWFLCASTAPAQSLGDLEIGQWAEFKGTLGPDRRFECSAIEVLAPGGGEVLIGTVSEVDVQRERFYVLGEAVHVSSRTTWQDLALSGVRGKRVKVDGHYRGPQKFSARSVAPRGEGRDRIEGRINALQVREGGLEASVMDFQVWIPADVKFENQGAFDTLPLAPEVQFLSASGRSEGEEDYIPGSFELLKDLYLGGLVEYKGTHLRDVDLDHSINKNRDNQRLSFRAQLSWTPAPSFRALFSPRFEFDDRRQVNGTDESTAKPHVNELWVYFSNVFGASGLDLQVGRMDFDDAREWIYKKNLDGARATWTSESLRLELSATTLVDDGSDRDKHTDNLMAYLSNTDPKRHLAAWIVDRRDDRDPRDYPIHFGLRALGEWIPENDVWAEASLLRGYSSNLNLRSYGFDLGTTWSPPFAAPAYFTIGYALGSGDSAGSTNTDESFRQTGFQHNNDKFGGVTTFRYYGEVVDPELSNLAIFTLGAGARILPKTSLDLVYHEFSQVEAATSLRNSNLRSNPDGISTDIGRELDLVFGTRALKGHDFEIVIGRFDPGSAFPVGEDAWVAAVQWRFRF